jgi:hypothetical protein
MSTLRAARVRDYIKGVGALKNYINTPRSRTTTTTRVARITLTMKI